ncbi:MAG TPA: phosphoribosylglycinamide formyltransferase [Candidatus Kapabacteria bacterium]|nr:phosphoribosylglycinamide formyltransferase [Candidatus Kapabacteria bacterium]
MSNRPAARRDEKLDPKPLRLAVLASGQGTNLQNILQKISSGELNGVELALVVSNNSASGAISVAEAADIPVAHISAVRQGSQQAADSELLRVLKAHSIDLIVLAGYMKKIPSEVTREFSGRIINVHPALLPKFGGAGMYGIKVHEAVIEGREKESGATAHLVTDEYDEGPVILQERCEVLPTDTPESLSQRVREVEFDLLPKAIQLIADKILNPIRTS